ncbi:MAG TPA: 1-acyl-sn-glycerol-3-phosphate acyltransferase [Edaphobacter sp.]|nr:1-acyl-sn-glycerol-3-phosphate acyltransferase [Edaphobacter sp.]
MSFLRSLGRSIRLAGMFAVAGTELLVKRPATREARADWLHRFAARAIRELGIEVDVAGSFPERGALISNHLGYLDIVVFAALHPCVFVSKAELQQVPVLGWMTTMSGTVYVARGHGGSAVKARSGMQAAADADLPVVFFPEGTTTNGSGMLRFHSGLLAQAMESGMPITAAYLRYRLDETNDATVADDVCYWGDAKMLPHIFKLLGLRGLRAEVRFAAGPIKFSSDLMHRKLAAVEARAAVAALGDG